MKMTATVATLCLLLPITTPSGAFEWEAWYDNAYEKASNLASDIAGDWCSGKEYGFSEMKVSDRIEAGSTDLLEQIRELNETSTKMLYDINFHIDENVKRAKQDNLDLVRRTASLCTSSRSSDNTAIDYGGITLRDSDEILAQVRLNIATIRSNREIISYLLSKKAQYNSLNEQIVRKANELAVVRKGFDHLMDPRSKSRSPAFFESTIKNACVSIYESDELMMQYDEKSLFELFRDASKQHKATTIPDSEVDSFMATCSEESLK